MTEEAGFHHAPGRITEIMAAEKIGPKLKTLRQAIIRVVRNSGEKGVIPDEAWAWVLGWRPGTPETSIRPRFIELQEEGKIRRNGKIRKNRRDSFEEVWVVGTEEGIVRKRRLKKAHCIGCLAHGNTKEVSQDALTSLREGRRITCTDCGMVAKMGK